MRAIGLLLLMLPLLGCPAEEVVDDPAMIWEPALDGDDSGTLDYGEVPTGELAQESITLTNNTDGNISFTLDVDLDGFLLTVETGEITLGPGAEFVVSPRLNPSAPAEYEGSIAFEFDRRIVTWTVLATAI